MNTTQQLAKEPREVYFGGNWTTCTIKDNRSDGPWEEAIQKFGTCYTIAAHVCLTTIISMP